MRKRIKNSVRRRIYDKNKGICQICNEKTRYGGNHVSPFSITPCAIDHIKPVKNGGTNEEGNLQLLCVTCNSQKGAK